MNFELYFLDWRNKVFQYIIHLVWPFLVVTVFLNVFLKWVILFCVQWSAVYLQVCQRSFSILQMVHEDRLSRLYLQLLIDPSYEEGQSLWNLLTFKYKTCSMCRTQMNHQRCSGLKGIIFISIEDVITASEDFKVHFIFIFSLTYF